MEGKVKRGTRGQRNQRRCLRCSEGLNTSIVWLEDRAFLPSQTSPKIPPRRVSCSVSHGAASEAWGPLCWAGDRLPGAGIARGLRPLRSARPSRTRRPRARRGRSGARPGQGGLGAGSAPAILGRHSPELKRPRKLRGSARPEVPGAGTAPSGPGSAGVTGVGSYRPAGPPCVCVCAWSCLVEERFCVPFGAEWRVWVLALERSLAVDGALVACLQEDLKKCVSTASCCCAFGPFSLALPCLVLPAPFSTLTVVETGSRRNKAFKKKSSRGAFSECWWFWGLRLVKISCAVCINKLEAGLQGILIKFAYDTKFGGDANFLEGRGLAVRPWQIRGWGNHQLCETQQSVWFRFYLNPGNPGCPDRLGNKRLKSVMESKSCCLIIYG